MKVKSRHHLREDRVRRIKDDLRDMFGDAVDRVFGDKSFEIIETPGPDIVLVGGEPLIFYVDDEEPFPTVKGALQLKPEKRRVTVDMGAVKHVSKGADVMSPGIVDADPDIREGDLVIVVDEVHGKALAVGRALTNAEGMMGEKGKAVKSIHHVGDRIWKLDP